MANEARAQLMRAVARTPAFRSRVSQLSRRQPDDVWFQPALGWLLSYRLLVDSGQNSLVFVVSTTQPHEVRTTVVVEWADDGTMRSAQSLPLDSPNRTGELHQTQ